MAEWKPQIERIALAAVLSARAVIVPPQNDVSQEDVRVRAYSITKFAD